MQGWAVNQAPNARGLYPRVQVSQAMGDTALIVSELHAPYHRGRLSDLILAVLRCRRVVCIYGAVRRRDIRDRDSTRDRQNECLVGCGRPTTTTTTSPQIE